jgi:uncharacterized Zn-binding protein involved in type VI secretion
MGKPAARMGDTTAHGGSIVAGAPTVLIGGMPAARVGDMTTCPMAVPAPTPVPHVGGPIIMGSAGVLICGMPAARMGDQAMCPPMGPAPIVKGEPTVLIGETGGGAGGGGGGAGGAGSSGSGGGSSAGQAGKASSAASGSGDASADGGPEQEDHRLDVSFTDKGGHPIAGVRFDLSGPQNTTARGQLIGGVRKTGLPAGDYDIELRAITMASWSSLKQKVGEEVTLQVATAGFTDGTRALLEVFRRDTNSPDVPVHTIEAEVSGDKVEARWTPAVTDELLAHQDECHQAGRYSNPFYVFKATIGSLTIYSALMQLRDRLEVVVKDDQGQALADRQLTIFFPNGEIRVTRTDGSGKFIADDTPCGRYRISLDVRA